MADVSIDYGMLESIASKAKSLQSQFDEMRESLKSLVDDLGGQWQGAGKAEFLAAYSNLKPKLNTISTTLGGYETALKGAVNYELKTESSTASNFKSI